MALALVAGSGIALGSGMDGNGAARETRKSAEAREASQAKWQGEIEKQYSGLVGDKGATGISCDAKRIVKKEMRKADFSMDAELVGDVFEQGANEGTLELWVYFDDGSVEVSGPWREMPRRVEITHVDMGDDILESVLIVEE